MTTVKVREAARVIVLDESDRVLLLRYDEGAGVFWATPGGALETGEDYAQAARREIGEELGITAFELGPQLATRAKQHLIYGQPVRQIERYFVARIRACDLDPASATQTDDILAWDWWSLPDLHDTGQTVYPVGLTSLISGYLTTGAPQDPIALAG